MNELKLIYYKIYTNNEATSFGRYGRTGLQVWRAVQLTCNSPQRQRLTSSYHWGVYPVFLKTMPKIVCIVSLRCLSSIPENDAQDLLRHITGVLYPVFLKTMPKTYFVVSLGCYIQNS